METVEIEDDSVSDEAIVQESDIAQHTEQVFRMYGGPQENVMLEFDQSLIGVVYDKFGEGIRMKRFDKTACAATVKVQVSPTFWGWIFQFAGKLKIVSPPAAD